jgi:hypothetical protein
MDVEEYKAIVNKAWEEYKAKTKASRAMYITVKKESMKEFNAVVEKAWEEYIASHPE